MHCEALDQRRMQTELPESFGTERQPACVHNRLARRGYDRYSGIGDRIERVIDAHDIAQQFAAEVEATAKPSQQIARLKMHPQLDARMIAGQRRQPRAGDEAVEGQRQGELALDLEPLLEYPLEGMFAPADW